MITQINPAEGSVALDPPKPAIKTRTKEVAFQLLVGAAHKLLPSLESGATAAVLAFASPAPTACFEVYAAWKDNDAKLAQLKQDRITKASQQMAAKYGVPGVKYAMELNGYYGGNCRLPLLPLSGDEKREIEDLMRDIKN